MTYEVILIGLVVTFGIGMFVLIRRDAIRRRQERKRWEEEYRVDVIQTMKRVLARQWQSMVIYAYKYAEVDRKDRETISLIKHLYEQKGLKMPYEEGEIRTMRTGARPMLGEEQARGPFRKG